MQYLGYLWIFVEEMSILDRKQTDALIDEQSRSQGLFHGGVVMDYHAWQ